MGRGRTTATLTNRVSSLLQVCSDEEYGLHFSTVISRRDPLAGGAIEVRKKSHIRKGEAIFFVQEVQTQQSCRSEVQEFRCSEVLISPEGSNDYSQANVQEFRCNAMLYDSSKKNAPYSRVFRIRCKDTKNIVKLLVNNYQ